MEPESDLCSGEPVKVGWGLGQGGEVWNSGSGGRGELPQVSMAMTWTVSVFTLTKYQA